MRRPPATDPRRIPRSSTGNDDGSLRRSLLSLLAIVGPTGTGKSDLAVEVADRIGGEIVGCDALQVYRDFDCATAKPGARQRHRVPHHLVDFADPRSDFSLADYVRLADRVVAEVVARGRVPIVVGGTGMYLRGLLRGVVDAPGRNDALRRRLRGMANRFGAPRLHRWLAGLDRVSAERLPERDTQRIVRALEIALEGGPTWSQRLGTRGTWEKGPERYRALKVVLDMDRDTLARRLDERVDSFFENGLVAEVRALLAGGVPAGANAFKAIGYREVLRALRSGRDPLATIEEVRRNTRRYAKRQRTWFRRETGAVVRLDAARPRPELVEDLVRRWTVFAGSQGVPGTEGDASA